VERRILGLILILLFCSGPAFAQDAGGPGAQFGILYGRSVPDAENTNPFGLAGVKGEGFVTPVFTLGGYYLVSDKSGEPAQTDKFRYSLHGIQGSYRMPSAKGEAFLSLRTGITKLKTTNDGLDRTFSPYHYGVATGYDFVLLSWLSVGFEGSYLHVQDSKTTEVGARFQERSFNIINFMVALQLRL